MTISPCPTPCIGVGLRHPHYDEALSSHDALAQPPVDFLEIHAENFFSDGGAALSILDAVAQRYPISIHGTAMGLGSLDGIPEHHVRSLEKLVHRIDPMLVSEHAAFTWGHHGNQIHHAGDLLPIAFNDQTLTVLADNVAQVQDTLKRQLLIENLSAYLTPTGSTYSETEFLSALVDRTGCRLLVDINNLAVNAFNAQVTPPKQQDIVHYITQWLSDIPRDSVGEIHLAGCTPVEAGDIMIDDHSHKISDAVWQGYRTAIERFGQVPTLIEWDTNLPEWQTLLEEASKARTIAHAVLETEELSV